MRANQSVSVQLNQSNEYSLSKKTSNHQNCQDEKIYETMADLTGFANCPQKMFCSFCGKTIITKIRYKVGLLVYLSSGACLTVCCLFGCWLLPFCSKKLRDIVHFCPNCQKILGQHKKI